MAGITTIIAVVGLLTGIAAVWLVTEAIGKIEKRTQKMVEVQIRGLRQSVVDLTKTVKDLHGTQETVVNRVRDVVRNRESADVELASLRKELDAITSTLAEPKKKPNTRSSRM